MAPTVAPPQQPAQPAASPPKMASTSASSSSSSYSLFPPIPAPLQRLFDLVPLVTYPANALPGGDDGATDALDSSDSLDNGGSPSIPTLYVFIDPADAARGRASFNPTCLKWQTFLRFAKVPVHLAASSNHASPTGALPFLQPARRRRPSQTKQSRPAAAARSTTTITTITTTTATAASTSLPPPPPPRPIPAHDLPAYAKKAAAERRPTQEPPLVDDSSSSSSPSTLRDHPRAPAYQALLDTNLRRAWLHAVYLDDAPTAASTTTRSLCQRSSQSIASRLYAPAASASPLVQAALAHQLRAAAAAEVWGNGGGQSQATATATAQLYQDAEAALSALSTLLEGEGGEEEEEKADYFFNNKEPTLFDAAVFSYTHLLLEDGDSESDGDSGSVGERARFRWHNRVLPDMVRAHPRLVQHRDHIVARYWQKEQGKAEDGDEKPGQTLRDAKQGTATSAAAPPPGTSAPGVADSVSWVKI